MNHLNSISIAVLSASLLGCGGEVYQRSIDEDASAQAGSFERLSGPIHSPAGWSSRVEVFIDRTDNEFVKSALRTAIKTWNDAADADIARFNGVYNAKDDASLFESLGDDTTVVYLISQWNKTTGKSPTVLGTTIWENSANDPSSISKGDIKLNTQNYRFIDSANPPADVDSDDSYVDAETVLLHELGHLFGLDHVNDEEDSAMLPRALTGVYRHNRDLGDGDIERIREIYRNR